MSGAAAAGGGAAGGGGGSYLLLLGGAEVGPLLPAVLLLGGQAVGVLRHVLRLLHQLRRLQALHGDDVEGVQILDGGWEG